MVGERQMAVTWHVDYREWMRQVLAFDGVLPVVVLGVPEAAALLLPQRPDVIEILAIFLPIGSFLIRFYRGKHRINANGCGQVTRLLQKLALTGGVFLLMVTDALLILMRDVQIRLGRKQAGIDWQALAEVSLVVSVALAIYLPLAVFAMYPGRTVPVSPSWCDVDPRSGIRRIDVDPWAIRD